MLRILNLKNGEYLVGISTYLEINQKYFLFQGYLLWGLSHLPEVKGMTRQFHLWNRLEAQPGSKTRICNFKLKSTYTYKQQLHKKQVVSQSERIPNLPDFSSQNSLIILYVRKKQMRVSYSSVSSSRIGGGDRWWACGIDINTNRRSQLLFWSEFYRNLQNFTISSTPKKGMK